MLVLGLEVWPWQKIQGQNLGRLQKFTINFHRLEHGDWSELYFKIHVPYLITVGNCGLVRVLEKTAFRYILS